MWRAWLEPHELCRWQADAARVLGDGRILLSWPALGAELEVELSVRKQLHALELRAGRFTIEVELTPGEVRLTHHGTRSDDETAGVRAAWSVSLALLAHYLERHSGRNRRSEWLTRTVALPPAALHAFFTDPVALGTWLGKGTIGRAGSEYRVELPSGRVLSGQVLANVPGHDVAVCWRESGSSALVLRTLPAGAEQRLLLMWSIWDAPGAPEPAEIASTIEELEGALARLALGVAHPALA